MRNHSTPIQVLVNCQIPLKYSNSKYQYKKSIRFSDPSLASVEATDSSVNHIFRSGHWFNQKRGYAKCSVIKKADKTLVAESREQSFTTPR